MPTQKNRWLALLFVSLAVALVIVDTTIINVAIPAIVTDLEASSTDVQWIQESYTLVFAALLLVFGALADKWGRRSMLLVGLSFFIVSSIFAAMSDTAGALIAWRVIQGIGGAMVLPTTLSIVNATFQGKERGIAFAVWGSTIGGMVAVGPLLGGWLTTEFSWNWAFGINIPLGVLITIGVFLFVTESKDVKHARAIDWLGAVLSVLASGSLVFGLIEGRNFGWWNINKAFEIGDWTWPLDISVVPIAFMVTALTVSMYIVHGLRRQKAGKSTLIAFGLFSIPSFRNGNLVAMIVSMGEFGIILALPLWLQFVLGYSAFESGLVILALAVGSFVASGVAAGLGSRLKPTWIIRIGLILEMIGVAGIGLMISPEATGWSIVPFLFVYGMGVGFATAQLTGVVLQDVPVAASGQGSGTSSTSRQIGSALGIAVIGTVLFSTAQFSLESSLADRNVPDAMSAPIVAAVIDSAGGAISGLEANPATADFASDAKDAMSTGTASAAYLAAGFLAVALVASFSLGASAEKRSAARKKAVR
ncbi:MAG: DHA2 family efflux MFS transporter permease subunit [Actinobacteria bacterium]|nr:DHA2 family efflux MFS transporter permease subunit [Actinomycetota bacterium]